MTHPPHPGHYTMATLGVTKDAFVLILEYYDIYACTFYILLLVFMYYRKTFLSYILLVLKSGPTVFNFTRDYIQKQDGYSIRWCWRQLITWANSNWQNMIHKFRNKKAHLRTASCKKLQHQIRKLECRILQWNATKVIFFPKSRKQFLNLQLSTPTYTVFPKSWQHNHGHSQLTFS
jgi:hypothetical protein